MSIKLTLSSSPSPPIAALAVVELTKSEYPVEITWGKQNIVTIKETSYNCDTVNDVCRILAREAPKYNLYGSSPLERTQVDHWLTFSLSFNNDIPAAISYLDKILGPITYLVANKLTIADLVVFGALHLQWKAVSKNPVPNNVNRWYNLIKNQSSVQESLKSLPKDVSPTNDTGSGRASVEKTSGRNQEGKFVDLPGAEMGKVVVRFPPEASGYLHIGHAKAALLNQYYQQAFQGKLIMRFDDTNPAKENVHFEQVILEDLEMLEIKPDLFTHTSQYFDLMLEYCEQLLKNGKAYVDDTEPEKMKAERDAMTESANRSNSVEKNFGMWNEMLKGSPAGQKCCVRVKINMQSPNGCLRDPTIYRCKNEPHPRTGTKYKVYPTYDFACPIVDAIEGVTHTLRTMEYHDRDEQFYWFIEALNLRRPYIWEYSRLSMVNTVLSKRKLTWFVEQGLVDGWDDPRFPTVRGVLRRGMTVEGLKQFIIAQGSSRSVVFMEWDKIWAFNKKVIDPIAPRYTALELDTVPVLVKNVAEQSTDVNVHPKDASIGTKAVWTGPRILIDRVDADQLKEGENATFINWGNLCINKINKANGKITSIDATPNLENKDFKKTLKLTWLCETSKAPFTKAYCVFFDHIINKALLGKDEDFKQYIGHETRTEIEMLGDPELKKLKTGDIIQLQRRGFFKVDVPYTAASELSGKEQPIILFHIPDGHTKETTNKPKSTVEKRQTSTGPKTEAGQSVKELNEKIIAQGDLVRDLKSKKAAKGEIDAAVQTLLALKKDFKSLSGQDWKPGCLEQESSVPIKTGSGDLNSRIVDQGNVVRDLKTNKAAKVQIEEAVKILLNLKAEYKKETGSDWKPVASPAPAAANTSNDSADLNNKIIKQGDLVRDLKAKKAAKGDIDSAVKVLLELKAEYKKSTGQDWKPGASPAPAPAVVNTLNDSADLNNKITKQGDLVRDLKAKKVGKGDIDSAVKVLLELKAEYKKSTGQDWKPGASPAPAPAVVNTLNDSADLNNKITKQGDLVRDLKAKKAAKGDIDSAVKILLELKGEYKKSTGQDWKPSASPVPAPTIINTLNDSADLNNKITKQGDLVRDLKAKKAAKGDIDSAVKALLELKGEYKKSTGQDWKPGASPVTALAITNTLNDSADLNNKIVKQGDLVRDLKAKKAAKGDIDSAVKILLELKAEYKKSTGQDWKPNTAKMSDENNSVITKVASQVSGDQSIAQESRTKETLTEQVNVQGNIVRDLKAKKASKDEINDAVNKLLNLKAEYKNVTGTDFPAAPRNVAPPKSAPKKEQPKKNEKKQDKKQTSDESAPGLKKQTRLCLEAKKEENLPDWYSQVLTKGEMIEYYDVSGCYILNSTSIEIWNFIRKFFDAEIKKLGVKECYFPIFVSRRVLEKEKSHIADFAPEVAWVTKSGDTDLAEPIAIRPTSETVIYPTYAKWIQSYRDLPLRKNQWSNVVRWEFSNPQPFLRTREFLWQEGHTAFASKQEADEEVLLILELYAQVYTDLLALPVIKGRKSEKEKFAGADYTTSVESFVSASGRGIQGATSHHLGQNFSKMFHIEYEHPETQKKEFVYQNSWGLSTRTIGVAIMVHGDNQGLVLPPRVAEIQVVIVPCGVTVSLSEEDKKALQKSCDSLEKSLQNKGIRVEGDYRDYYSPGWKFNHWELKGIPIRIELGPKDMKNNQFVAVRRDTGEKLTIPLANAEERVTSLLDEIHESMLAKATKEFSDHTIRTKDWEQFCSELDRKNVLLSPFCGDIKCEEQIKTDSARVDAEPGAPAMGAKTLCIPFDQPVKILDTDKCININCQKKPLSYALFGRSY